MFRVCCPLLVAYMLEVVGAIHQIQCHYINYFVPWRAKRSVDAAVDTEL